MGPNRKKFKLEKKRVEIRREETEKKRMPTKKAGSKKCEAFTLIELVIVVVILAIIAGLAVPEIFEGIKESRGERCGAALRLIEGAKDSWRKDYPDWQTIWSEQNRPTQADLEGYIPGGAFPSDPWGVGFVNPLNPGVVTSHARNGVQMYEPRGNNSTENGFNDVFQLSR